MSALAGDKARFQRLRKLGSARASGGASGEFRRTGVQRRVRSNVRTGPITQFWTSDTGRPAEDRHMQTVARKSVAEGPPSKPPTAKAPDIASVPVPDTLEALHVNPDTGLTHAEVDLSLIHISEPTRLGMISYAVFCL